MTSAGHRDQGSVFVPIGMPDDILAELMARYGKVQLTRRLHYKETDLRHYENGVRVTEFDALTQPIPSRVNFAGINIGFKYTGQPKTCVRCMSFDHLVKDCTATRRAKTTQDQHPKKPSPPVATTFDQTTNHLQKPSPPVATDQEHPSMDTDDLPFGDLSSDSESDDSNSEDDSSSSSEEDEETKTEATNTRLTPDIETTTDSLPATTTSPKLGAKRRLQLQSPTKISPPKTELHHDKIRRIYNCFSLSRTVPRH